MKRDLLTMPWRGGLTRHKPFSRALRASEDVLRLHETAVVEGGPTLRQGRDVCAEGHSCFSMVRVNGTIVERTGAGMHTALSDQMWRAA